MFAEIGEFLVSGGHSTGSKDELRVFREAKHGEAVRLRQEIQGRLTPLDDTPGDPVRRLREAMGDL